MADLGERLNKEKLDNYISVLLALRFMVSGLQDFVVERLKLKQTEIEQNHTLGRCNLNCSRTFGKSFSKWCNTCKHCKFELRFLHRSSTHWNRIKWSEIDSKYFLNSFDEIAKVFVKDFHTVMQAVLKDFSAIMSLIRNATLFDVSTQMIDDNLRIRNSYCAHNSSAELNESEKNICFYVFVRFLKIPEIKCTDTGRNALYLFKTLQLSHGIPDNILLDQEGRLALIEVVYALHNDGNDQPMEYARTKIQKRLQEVTCLHNKRKR
ncbi:Hypothetical predicted protein [Mytilus galloprovincialis]|uniref:Uncharacterized protein n=1 Tax=Mytilus galloprovincialis TaxID=29158 RepID=A0A8B6F733_MYTGA|nr:Hypothetical predicted protein [Mytilus galloprovincialis]